ncbi:MAG: hypothetical protein HWN66_14820 [Candidatus Helarchaeota archaeon]|nr:hypothetical protein [Candidatus Helarchaeota archaeon]
MPKTKDLIINAVFEDNVENVVEILKKRDKLVKTQTCPLCGRKMEKIGAFMPKENKIIAVCGSLECILRASYETMRSNGNGSVKLKI